MKKAIVTEETLTDNSTVFNVMLKGEDVVNPPDQATAIQIAARMNRGYSAFASSVSLQIEQELIPDASEAIGGDIAERIDEAFEPNYEAFKALLEHLQALQELGIELGRTDANDHEPIITRAESALLRMTPVSVPQPWDFKGEIA